MGGSRSKYPRSPEIESVMRTFELSAAQVQRLWRIFNKGDDDHSGTIAKDEFHTILGELKSVFTDHLFSLTRGTRASNELSFDGFVSSLVRSAAAYDSCFVTFRVCFCCCFDFAAGRRTN
jgi:Ca2+-binding EF-hand superfamily protein